MAERSRLELTGIKKRVNLSISQILDRARGEGRREPRTNLAKWADASVFRRIASLYPPAAGYMLNRQHQSWRIHYAAYLFPVSSCEFTRRVGR